MPKRESNETFVSGVDEEVSCLSIDHQESDPSIDIDGVSYRKTDESEFRRALI